MALDDLDKKLLDIIQTDFPICPRPYAELGERLGITEEQALERVRGLKESKIIRRLGANFQSAKLGFRSTLCAAKVPEDKMDAYIGPSWEAVCNALADISAKTGIEILNLPAEKLYKIRVDFQME